MRKLLCSMGMLMSILILSLTLFAPTACRKSSRSSDYSRSGPQPAHVAHVKKWFDENWRNTSLGSSRVSAWDHDTSFIINNYANLVPDWRFTKVVHQGNVTYTQVPAELPDTLQFKIGSADTTTLASLLTDDIYRNTDQSKIFWLLREAPNESPVAEIVTFVGDFQYTKDNVNRFLTGVDYFDLDDYTGVVMYHDRFGQLIRSFQYERGTLVNTIRCGVEGGLDPDPGNRVHLDVCLEILTWERDCFTTYDENGTQNKQCTEWVLVGSHMVGNCWGTGGSGGSSNYAPYSENGMDCASFDFTQTASNWQEAGIKNAKVKILWLGGGRSGQYINVNIAAPIIVGLPRQNSGGIISPGKAAEIAAWANDRALSVVTASLKLNPTRPTDLEIENMYRRQVRNFLLLHGGTADRTGSGNPNIVIKDAKYKFLGNGDCD